MRHHGTRKVTGSGEGVKEGTKKLEGRGKRPRVVIGMRLGIIVLYIIEGVGGELE